MSLSVGIVGLPNVGKSTLFNAVLQKQAALAANYPFATIEPNVGVVEVPDSRLNALAMVIAGRDSIASLQNDSKKLERKVFPPLVRATVSFVDIAGLVKGASEGEGLGNKFLAHIRETDAICHVLRNFKDENVVRSGAVDAVEDLGVVRTELILKDMEAVEIQSSKLKAQNQNVKLKAILDKLQGGFSKELMANQILNREELEEVRHLFLLTAKPELFVLNSDEEDLARAEEIVSKFVVKAEVDLQQVVVICAKTEAELVELEGDERREYLQSLGLEESGLERLIKAAYKTLDLQSFLTAGEKEVRAWTIKKGMKAPEAAGVIHTDFTKNFIKALVCPFDEFVSLGGWVKAKEAGKAKFEGRDYVMKDGDVVEFMVGK